MQIINKKTNINILVGSMFLFLIVIFNPISWIYFFDSNGFLRLSRILIFFSFDILCLISSYYLFKNKNNKNYYKSFCSILSFNIFLLFFLLLLLQIVFGDWLYNNPWFNKSVVVSSKLSKYRLNNLYEADYEYINYSRDEFGFRGQYNAVDDINILKPLWVNFMKSGEWNPAHNHTGDISCVMFLQVPPEIGKENKTTETSSNSNTPTAGMLEFNWGNQGDYSASGFIVTPKVGDIYLFPAYMRLHRTIILLN